MQILCQLTGLPRVKKRTRRRMSRDARLVARAPFNQIIVCGVRLTQPAQQRWYIMAGGSCVIAVVMLGSVINFVTKARRSFG
jgi:hypothetical protein